MTAAVPLAPSSCHSVTSHIPASTDTQRPLILLAPTPSSSAPIPGFQLLSFAAQDLKPSDYRAGAFTAFILTPVSPALQAVPPSGGTQPCCLSRTHYQAQLWGRLLFTYPPSPSLFPTLQTVA